MKFQERGIEVEAFRLDSRPLIGEDWFWDAVSSDEIVIHNFGKYYGPAWCEIYAKDGTIYKAKVGDWIVKLPNDEIIRYPNWIFQLQFKPVPTLFDLED